MFGLGLSNSVSAAPCHTGTCCVTPRSLSSHPTVACCAVPCDHPSPFRRSEHITCRIVSGSGSYAAAPTAITPPSGTRPHFQLSHYNDALPGRPSGDPAVVGKAAHPAYPLGQNEGWTRGGRDRAGRTWARYDPMVGVGPVFRRHLYGPEKIMVPIQNLRSDEHVLCADLCQQVGICPVSWRHEKCMLCSAC